MRRRLLLSFLTVALTTIAVVCAPLGVISDSVIRQDFTHRLDRNLDLVAAALTEMTLRGRVISQQDLAGLVPADRRAIWTPQSGTPVSAGQVHGAVASQALPLPGGTVTMQAPLSILRSRLLRLWLLIGALAVFAIGFAAALSLWTSRRLSAPLEELAADAERIGRGNLRPRGRRFGIAELDRLSATLDQGAVNLGHILDDERRFVRDASHQLRTPLASLSVRLEAMASRPEPDADTDAALEQVERLSQVVSSILDHRRTRPGAEAIPIDVQQLLSSQQREWGPAFARRRRRLSVSATATDLRVTASPGGIEQAIATLLDNALIHGAGDVTLSSRPVGTTHVGIDVTDNGPGIEADLADSIFLRGVSTGPGPGTGLGLPLARAIVESDAGRLELTGQGPTRFTVFLPSAPTRG